VLQGFFFVESMITSQLENLTGGGIGGEIFKGKKGEDTGAKKSLERQFMGAAAGRFGWQGAGCRVEGSGLRV
jgi:hypothetical protein